MPLRMHAPSNHLVLMHACICKTTSNLPTITTGPWHAHTFCVHGTSDLISLTVQFDCMSSAAAQPSRDMLKLQSYTVLSTAHWHLCNGHAITSQLSPLSLCTHVLQGEQHVCHIAVLFLLCFTCPATQIHQHLELSFLVSIADRPTIHRLPRLQKQDLQTEDLKAKMKLCMQSYVKLPVLNAHAAPQRSSDNQPAAGVSK